MNNECIRVANYSLSQQMCSENQKSNYLSPSTLYTLPEEKRFNGSKLPKHIDKNTIFGIQTNNKSSALDLIFPDRSTGTKFTDAEDKTEFYKKYKSSYYSKRTGKQLIRNYPTNFDPNYRHGVTSKQLPVGIWFKSTIDPKPSKDSENVITNCITKILQESENDKRGRYPYIDNRQGKFLRRSYLRAVDLITENEPNEKYFDRIELLSAINKIKHTVKKKQCDLKSMFGTYEYLDKKSTGWLPLEKVYDICYLQYQIRPDKKLFDIALNLIHAIDNNSVRYDLFMDLLDPDVQFTVDLKNDNRRKRHEYITTYNTDYENISSQNVRCDKKIDYTTSELSHAPVKPIGVIDQECYGSETDIKTLLNPTIFSNYGLTIRDFYTGRSKEVMQKLFKDAGLNLSNDIFNLIWDNASQKSDNHDGKVNIEDFRQALRYYKAKTIDRQ